METFLLLLVVTIPVLYVVTLSIRWKLARRQAEKAIAALQSEVSEAKSCSGYQYGLRYQAPELMFQVITEVEDQLLAVQGTMILINLMVTRKQRLRWKAVSDLDNVVARCEGGIKALRDASFYAQFPTGTPMFADVRINGIPLRERCF